MKQIKSQMEEQVFKEHPYRYVILIVYFFTALVCSLPINTFASINSKVVVEVTLNTLLFPIAHTLFAFPCNWILNKKGIRIGYYISTALFITGMWLRTFLAVGDPYICLLGSLLSAIGGIFILNTPSRLALNWFKSQSVPLVTFTLVLVNVVSMGLGLTIPGLIIKSDSTAADIISFLRLQAIVATVPFIILAIVIREKPQNPPNKAALAFDQRKQQTYRSIMKALFTNREYIKLSISIALNFGTGTALLSLIEQMLTDLGYGNASQAISISGSSGILLGIFANIGYSYFIRKTKKYKWTLNIAVLGGFVGFVVWIIGLFYSLDKWWELVLISALFCISHASIPSIYVLFSTELAFPMDQASAAGYMIATYQTFGFVAGLLGASVLNGTPERARILFYVTIGLLFLSFLVGLTIKEDLRKLRFEQRNNLDREEDVEQFEVKKMLLDN